MTPPAATERAEKAALRSKARARRAALGAACRRRASARIATLALTGPRVRAAAAVFVYLSFGDEVDTGRLVEGLAASGRRVLVPYIERDGRMRAVPFPGREHLAPGPLGVPGPPPAPAWTGPIEVALVPGLAFTRAGDRLGFGAGYYDRWLAAHPETCPIALAFEAQIVPHVPVGTHDVPMTAVLTEAGPATPPQS